MKYIWLYLGLVLIALFIMIWMRNNSSKSITNQQIRQLRNIFPLHYRDIRLSLNQSSSLIIDHLLAGQTGIFLIHVENRNGIIQGEEPNETWTEQVKAEHTSFANPTHINLQALPIIRKLLNDTTFHYPIYPVVVFGKKANLDQVFCESTVIKCTFLKNYLSSITDKKITNEELEHINQIIN